MLFRSSAITAPALLLVECGTLRARAADCVFTGGKVDSSGNVVKPVSSALMIMHARQRAELIHPPAPQGISA